MSRLDDNSTFIEQESFPIRTVSKITGVNSITLRAWERRYGLITPKRTESGHRLYSKDDIQIIEQAKQLLAAGSSISQVSMQLKSTRDFENLLSEQPATIWLEYQDKMIDAITNFREDLLDAIYQEALSFHAINTVTNKLIIPILHKLGERWANQNHGSLAEEHFFSVYLRNKLGAQYHHRRARNNGPLLLTACMQGETHEFGLLLFGLLAHEHNYRIINLGSDMPLYEIPHVLKKTNADALVLSCNKNCPLNASIAEPISNLDNIPLFIGGDTTEEQKRLLSTYGSIFLDKNYQKTIEIINKKLASKLYKA